VETAPHVKALPPRLPSGSRASSRWLP
jgi:hypothetical protein